MAMPRPQGKAFEIAQDTVPGLHHTKDKPSALKNTGQDGSMSEVEIKQTNNISNKES